MALGRQSGDALSKTHSKQILVTGGAGFIGGSLAIALARDGHSVTALDNLQRRGSELNLPRLREAGVSFVHGDVREPTDLDKLAPHEVLIECSAEPSVLAGYNDDRAMFDANLVGAYNCLQLARRHAAQMIFLSTSRVYPVKPLTDAAIDEVATRLELAPAARQAVPGISEHGIAEDCPLIGARTFYGTTKLAGELMIAEYRDAHGLVATINRCGVVTGPWQMGKVDQGVFTYWVLAHRLGRPLSYIGFGGHGKQVRDLLHVDDLVDLVRLQVADPAGWDGRTFNVGGGREVSLSLLETTKLCAEITGNRVDVGAEAETRRGDVPVYISDCRALHAFTEWRPTRDPRQTLTDIHDWVAEHENELQEAIA